MTEKFDTVTQILTNAFEVMKPSTDKAERVFEAAQELDNGARDGLALITEWLEAESDKIAVERVDNLSTVALSLFAFKKIGGMMDDLGEMPEPMKKMMAEVKTAEMLAKFDHKYVQDASLQWISGFLFGVAYHKFVMNAVEDES
jgi:hypothetical protein